MSPTLHHECTRVPVTAVASCAGLLIAAEGPFLRFYRIKDSQYIFSRRVFKAQAVHGISVYSGQHDDVTRLVVWGGRLVCAIEIKLNIHNIGHESAKLCKSDVRIAPDWILDVAPRPPSLEDESSHQSSIYAAVTAHNAILQIEIKQRGIEGDLENSLLSVSIAESTSSSRSILYSAHLVWDTPTCLLVAAGTAFGEIMYWSWTQEPRNTPVSRIHRVFLGHEGSIFGVQISKELPSECYQRLKRVIASCSDDRTIRVWDVSDVNTLATVCENGDAASEVLRTRHTGFSNETFDANLLNSSNCLAIGWGHTSRVWTAGFLESYSCGGPIFLISAGEDATARTWELVPCLDNKSILPYKLLQLDSVTHHSGKNLWSSAFYKDPSGLQQVVCGGADSKITSSPLARIAQRMKHNIGSTITEYSVNDILSLAQPNIPEFYAVPSQSTPKPSSKAEFFRSYCFVDAETLLLTTNSGKILLSHLHTDAVTGRSGLLTDVTCVAHLEELSNYSVCSSGIVPGVAFVAGAKGNVFAYSKKANVLRMLHAMDSKVGDLLVADLQNLSDHGTVALLVTPVGRNDARLLYVDTVGNLEVSRVVTVPISEILTGSLAMSMVHVSACGNSYVFIGFRRGSIAAYSIQENGETCQASLLRVINRAHSGETVTCLRWFALSENSSKGHLVSVGRDGCFVVHRIDLFANSVELVHSLALPIGPNVEGIYLHQHSLLVHGFSSKKWVLYDVTAEEEVMSVETGGAHRS